MSHTPLGPFTALLTVPGTNILQEALDVPVVDSAGYEVAVIPFTAFSPAWLHDNSDKHWSGHEESHIERNPAGVRALARLFAAAPDLLEALKVLLGNTFSADESRLSRIMLGGTIASLDSPAGQALATRCDRIGEAEERARAAIAKAEGRKP